MPLTQPECSDACKCPECGAHAPVHICHEPIDNRRKCRYCWAPVQPRLSKRGTLLGWNEYCSAECRKLANRNPDAKPGAQTVALIRTVASR